MSIQSPKRPSFTGRSVPCPKPFRAGTGHETLPVKPWGATRNTPRSDERGAQTRRSQRIKPSMPRMPWD